jgi:hypothetical protein
MDRTYNIQDGPPEQRGGDLPLASQPAESASLLDHKDSSYQKIFGGAIRDQSQTTEQTQPTDKSRPTDKVQTTDLLPDKPTNLDYLKITNAAETLEKLAENRLDTTNATKGAETSKEMANLWGSLNQDERNAVWVSLLTRSDENGQLSGRPAPTLLRDMEGKITGLNFEAGSLDFSPGPKYLQITDSVDGSVDVKTKKGNWFSNKQNEYATDYHQEATPEFAKQDGQVPENLDYNKILKTADRMEFVAKDRLDTLNENKIETDSKELTETWKSLNKDEREAVWVALLTMSQTEHGDRNPNATVIKDMDGNITGLNFVAGDTDFTAGPKYLQITDGQDGTVVARSKVHNFFAKHDYQTDYVSPSDNQLKVVGPSMPPAQPQYLIMTELDSNKRSN